MPSLRLLMRMKPPPPENSLRDSVQPVPRRNVYPLAQARTRQPAPTNQRTSVSRDKATTSPFAPAITERAPHPVKS